jgi:hypothetical protein
VRCTAREQARCHTRSRVRSVKKKKKACQLSKVFLNASLFKEGKKRGNYGMEGGKGTGTGTGTEGWWW